MKKQEGSLELQKEVQSEEEWQTLMQTDGLVVVDVYATWCGPCKAIVNTFRKIKNEIGDDLLHFAIAETDRIESLISYRNTSLPTFLFYGDGKLVNAIRGCNGPLLIKSIGNLLKKEHQIRDGTTEREIFIDHRVSNGDEKTDKTKDESRNEEEEELVEVPKEVGIAIIKPDAVKAGLVDQIIEEISAAGLEILKTEERLLTKEEAAEFYKQHADTDHFEELIEFMSSGPCMTVVVSKPGGDVGEGLIPEFRNLIGPKDVNTAKEEAPESLRAKYGTDCLQNALHACDSYESAARELAFFYPDFNRPLTTKVKKRRLQRTLALIRPNALKKRKDSILKSIEDAGFVIAMEKEVHLTREQVEDFYGEHKQQDYFESLVSNMTCGPSLALCLAREDAVQTWRGLLGPKKIVNQPIAESQEDIKTNTSVMSLRERFSDPQDEINPLHGAESEEQVEREMNILFPMETTVAVIKPDVCENEDEKAAIIEKIERAGFKISAQKEVNLTKELAGMMYKEHEGKEFYDKLTDYMSSGPTQFLILSREDAVGGFRTLMGPTQPEHAKEVHPSSLRAQFAKDVIKNGIHGSSSASRAKEVIAEFFPDVKLDGNGLVIADGSTAKAADKDKNESLDSPATDDQHDAIKNGVAVEENGNSTQPTKEADQPSSEADNKEDSPQQQTVEVGSADAAPSENDYTQDDKPVETEPDSPEVESGNTSQSTEASQSTVTVEKEKENQASEVVENTVTSAPSDSPTEDSKVEDASLNSTEEASKATESQPSDGGSNEINANQPGPSESSSSQPSEPEVENSAPQDS